ncbi:MAG TPA: hemerythrin domain-containing protein [Pirellulales bacterium]|nr:hemerythrin domain-containing protein [Pirellulales bacterium]
MDHPNRERQPGEARLAGRAGAAAQRDWLSRRTRGEHDVLLETIHRLEAALASPAPGREGPWSGRVAHELRPVLGYLRAHVDSAEGVEGLCRELEASRPELAYRVEQLRFEHAKLLEMATALTRSAAPAETIADFSSIRQHAAELLGAIRSHYAREVDLIYECFCTDIGVGD